MRFDALPRHVDYIIAMCCNRQFCIDTLHQAILILIPAVDQIVKELRMALVEAKCRTQSSAVRGGRPAFGSIPVIGIKLARNSRSCLISRRDLGRKERWRVVAFASGAAGREIEGL